LKRPGWVTAVGILGIIQGSLGIMGAIQVPFLPKLVLAQSRMFSQTVAHGPSSPITDAMQQLMSRLVDDLTVNAPAWLGTWLVCLSIAMVLVFTLYVYASIRLLTMQPRAARWFAWATVAVGALQIVQAIGTTVAVPDLTVLVVPGLTFGLAIYAVLLTIVLVKSKQSVGPRPPPLPSTLR